MSFSHASHTIIIDKYFTREYMSYLLTLAPFFAIYNGLMWATLLITSKALQMTIIVFVPVEIVSCSCCDPQQQLARFVTTKFKIILLCLI